MNTAKHDRIKSIFRRKILPLFSKLNGPVTDDLETAIIEHSNIITAVKDQYIAESDEAEDGHLIYFESGIARCYYYNAIADKYIITRITRKDEILIDINAYLYGSRLADNIQMLESGTLITLSYANLKLLLSEFQSIYPAFLYFLAEREKQHAAYQHLLKSSVEQRVRIFLEENPGIATRINNDHIASYLDMSRTTFSSAYAKFRAKMIKIINASISSDHLQ
jgi:CRP-like cAMP-binding protein